MFQNAYPPNKYIVCRGAQALALGLFQFHLLARLAGQHIDAASAPPGRAGVCTGLSWRAALWALPAVTITQLAMLSTDALCALLVQYIAFLRAPSLVDLATGALSLRPLREYMSGARAAAMAGGPMLWLGAAAVIAGVVLNEWARAVRMRGRGADDVGSASAEKVRAARSAGPDPKAAAAAASAAATASPQDSKPERDTGNADDDALEWPPRGGPYELVVCPEGTAQVSQNCGLCGRNQRAHTHLFEERRSLWMRTRRGE
eukprot:350699-Chlamydomonas_euryale.AAC.9